MNPIELNKIRLSFDKTVLFINEGQNAFTITVSQPLHLSNLSLLIDIYDANNPVHPEGHIGWWRYPIETESTCFSGILHRSDNKITPTLNAMPENGHWVNDSLPETTAFEFMAVLRDSKTGDMIAIEKIPAVVKNEYNWQIPVFFKQESECIMPGVVRLISHHIVEKDAVGNFCLDIYRLCMQNKIPIVLYASNFHLGKHSFIEHENNVLSDTQPEDTILYFHSTHDPFLESIAAVIARKKIAYFHGITHPDYFTDSDIELHRACQKAFAQLPFFSHFDVISANSNATATLLSEHVSEMNLNHVVIIPPKLIPVDTTLSEKNKKRFPTQLLYVGRFKSHKKIEDILQFFSHYLLLDPQAELNLAGELNDVAYKKRLHDTEEQYLGVNKNQVRWFGKVSNEHLKKMYEKATVYISMSEDEGFCLPLLEAMMENAIVFAYGIPAVKEVLGDAGVYFAHKNFALLAKQLHDTLNDTALIKALLEKQQKRTMQLLKKMDGQSVLDIIEEK